MQENMQGSLNHKENNTPSYEIRKLSGPDYQTEAGYKIGKGFKFDPEADYYELIKVTPTKEGQRNNGQGIVEFKKNNQGKYEAKYVTFKQHGANDYWSYDKTAQIPAPYTIQVREKLAVLNRVAGMNNTSAPKSPSEPVPDLNNMIENINE